MLEFGPMRWPATIPRVYSDPCPGHSQSYARALNSEISPSTLPPENKRNPYTDSKTTPDSKEWGFLSEAAQYLERLKSGTSSVQVGFKVSCLGFRVDGAGLFEV